jgi:hypothetical protein
MGKVKKGLKEDGKGQERAERGLERSRKEARRLTQAITGLDGVETFGLV